MALKYLYVPSGYKAGKTYGVLPNEAAADLAFVRASGATRVDSNRLIDKGESLGSNIEPTDFSSGWTGVGSGMTLSTGSAEFDNDALNVGAYIQTSSNITLGTSYRIIIEVTSFTSAAAGGLYYYSVNGSTDLNVEGVGTYEYTFTAQETRTFVLNSYTGTTLTVGSVSLREITTENTNTPRLDYTDGSCPTLLTEPQRTNLCLNSTRGTYGNSPASTAQTLAPDGTNTATIPTPNDTADRYEYTISAGSATGDTKITYSWYRKRLSTPSRDPNRTGDLQIKGLVNCIQDGSTIQIGSDIGGYDRFSATFDVIDGSLEAIIRLYFGEVVGVGNSSVAYFGHQVEVGEYATSYIPTSGATVTRSADTGVISEDLSSYINSSEGVLEIKAKALFNGRPDARIGLSDGTLDNRVTLSWREGVNKMSLFMQANGSNVLDGGAVEFKNFTLTHDQTEMTTFKIKWKSGDIQVKVNGTVVLTDTSSFSGLTLNQLSLDKATQINQFEGNVQYIKVYDSITDF